MSLLSFLFGLFSKKASSCCTMPTFEGSCLFHTKMTKHNPLLVRCLIMTVLLYECTVEVCTPNIYHLMNFK